MDCLNIEVKADCFALLKDVLTENKLLNSPGRIYNVDGTDIALDGYAPIVLVFRVAE